MAPCSQPRLPAAVPCAVRAPHTCQAPFHAVFRFCCRELSTIAGKGNVRRLERAWDASNRKECFQADQDLRQVGAAQSLACTCARWVLRRCLLGPMLVAPWTLRA